jgi:hypothetical protein
MVYCDSKDIPTVKSQLPIDFEVLINEKNVETLRNLDKLKNTILIVTEMDLMRGVDYRAYMRGMELYLMKGFQHERDRDQGLGRVGRFDEAGLRFKMPGLAIIDKHLKNQYLARINAVLDADSKNPECAKAQPVTVIDRSVLDEEETKDTGLMNAKHDAKKMDKKTKSYTTRDSDVSENMSPPNHRLRSQSKKNYKE